MRRRLRISPHLEGPHPLLTDPLEAAPPLWSRAVAAGLRRRWRAWSRAPPRGGERGAPPRLGEGGVVQGSGKSLVERGRGVGETDVPGVRHHMGDEGLMGEKGTGERAARSAEEGEEDK